MTTVSLPESTKVGVRVAGLPGAFHRTTLAAVNPIPVSVTVTVALPASTPAGLTEVSTGEMCRVWGLDTPAGVPTVMAGCPERARRSGVMAAFNSVSLTYVVASAVAPSLATDDGTKPIPRMARRK
jgi:hypothetical protein